MSKAISEFKVNDILPPNLKIHPEAIAMAEADFKAYAPVIEAIERLYVNIDNADSDQLDLLAYEEHVDFYDQSLPLEIRRELVKNSIKWHSVKGTPYAAEEIIKTIFGTGEVKEWFEYGGEPYFFMIITENESISDVEVNVLVNALNSVKRKSAWLEKVIIKFKTSVELRARTIIHDCIHQHVRVKNEKLLYQSCLSTIGFVRTTTIQRMGVI